MGHVRRLGQGSAGTLEPARPWPARRSLSASARWVTTQGAVSATIRLSASIPIVCTQGSLTINEHIRAREATSPSVRGKEKVTAATLQTRIEVNLMK